MFKTLGKIIYSYLEVVIHFTFLWTYHEIKEHQKGHRKMKFSEKVF